MCSPETCLIRRTRSAGATTRTKNADTGMDLVDPEIPQQISFTTVDGLAG